MSRSAGHTALAARPTAFPSHPLVTSLLHRFELWTVLECHAVSHVASRDLRSIRTQVRQLNQEMLSPGDPQEWQQLELNLHAAIAAQAGNPLLATMVEHLGAELRAICEDQQRWPTQRAGTLWLLQCQHRKILSCIEAGQAEDAVLHTRAHLHLLRDQLVAALSGWR
ncbi:MAG: FCD domain-containing protein [Chloroflexi bacterium]|nr:FCD domain-containing protein [Chloroflexota bacterium]MBV9135296.1 FCD domain-containing protein [Chloroflexota bacterium]MBV9892834.1 FCD domain-containing protein [Chloroflexota bacterium]